MAFNGSGTYNLPAGNPVVTGTTISSSTTNTTNSDIATALTNCITRDGQSTPSANLPMNAKKLTGLAAGTSAGDSVRYEQVVLTGAALGTPTSGTLTNCTGYTYANLSGTVPTWNQNTTGTAANLTSATTLPSGTTLVAPVLGTPSSGTLSSCTVDGTNGVGYINIPQNSQSAAYTLVAADAGKHIFHPSTDANARTFTIPANGSVAYPIGTAISFVNMTSQVVSIAITTDTMYLAGTGTTGTRSLAQYGTATALKMTSTTWIISGAGLT
jgi:hypothetical protein